MFVYLINDITRNLQ